MGKLEIYDEVVCKPLPLGRHDASVLIDDIRGVFLRTGNKLEL